VFGARLRNASDGSRKGVMISMETQQNQALVTLIWMLCLIAIVGLIVGYIIIKP